MNIDPPRQSDAPNTLSLSLQSPYSIDQPLTPSPSRHPYPILPLASLTPPCTSPEEATALSLKRSPNKPRPSRQGPPLTTRVSTPTSASLMPPPQYSSPVHTLPQSHPYAVLESSAPISLHSSQSTAQQQQIYGPPTPQLEMYPQSYPSNPYFPTSAPMSVSGSSQSQTGQQSASPRWTPSTDLDGFQLDSTNGDLDMSFALQFETSEATGQDMEANYYYRPRTPTASLSEPIDPQYPVTPITPASTSRSPTKTLSGSASKTHTPRPPNAWILYRSDMLKAIAAGETLPGLNEVMAEAGRVSSSGPGSSNEESSAEIRSSTTPVKKGKGKGKGKFSRDKEVEDQAVLGETDGGDGLSTPANLKTKKGKKGAREPTEGLLSLGRGKTGRGLPQADISKMISMLWKRESQEVRSKYEKMSEQKKNEHQQLYPDYKFQPLRKAEKLKQRVERQREKEELKREKDANRGGRKRNDKTKLFQTSPYAYTDRPPIARSLSYSGGTSPYTGRPGYEARWTASASQDIASYPHDTSPTPMEHRFRMDPFPFGIASVPSLDPSLVNGGNSSTAESSNPTPLNGVSSNTSPSIGTPSQVGFRTPSHPDISRHLHDSNYKPDPGSSGQGWHPQHVPLPPPHPVHSNQSPSYTVSNHQPVTQAQSEQDMYPPVPQPVFFDIPGLGSAYGEPLIFEPIPIPGEECIESLQPVGDMDPTALAAMWCEISGPTEEVDFPAGHSGEPSGSGVVLWNQEVFGALDNWATLGDGNDVVFENLDLSQATASQLHADLYPGDAPPVLYSYSPSQADHFPMQYSQPVFDPSTGYVTVQYLDANAPQSSQDQEGYNNATSSDFGPFLSTLQPLSPGAFSSGFPTPRELTFRRSIPNSNASSRPSSSSASNGDLLGGNTGISSTARYVSNSAYPSASLSSDPATGAGWGDRTASFAAAAAAMMDPELAATGYEDWGGEGSGDIGDDGHLNDHDHPRLSATMDSPVAVAAKTGISSVANRNESPSRDIPTEGEASVREDRPSSVTPTKGTFAARGGSHEVSGVDGTVHIDSASTEHIERMDTTHPTGSSSPTVAEHRDEEEQVVTSLTSTTVAAGQTRGPPRGARRGRVVARTFGGGGE